MRLIGVPVEASSGLIGQKIGNPRLLGVLRKCFDDRPIRCVQRRRVRIGPWNHAFLGASVVEKSICDRVDLPSVSPDCGWGASLLEAIDGRIADCGAQKKGTRKVIQVPDVRQAIGGPHAVVTTIAIQARVGWVRGVKIVKKARRYGRSVNADFLIGGVRMLIANEKEKFVLLDWES